MAGRRAGSPAPSPTRTRLHSAWIEWSVVYPGVCTVQMLVVLAVAVGTAHAWLEVTGKSFEKDVLAVSKTKPVLFAVSAPWCGHCKVRESCVWRGHGC